MVEIDLLYNSIISISDCVMYWTDNYKQEFKQIREWLRLKQKLIVHHRDVDGNCAAAQLLKFFEFESMSIKDPFVSYDLVNELVEKNPQFIVFLDLAVDEHWENVVSLQTKLKNTKIVVFDHHVIRKDLNDFGIIHINPRFIMSDAYIPTSLMVFDLLKCLGLNIESQMWISIIGTISDYGHKANPEFMKLAKETYPGFMKGSQPIKTKLGDAAKTIYSGIICRGEYGSRYALNALVKSKGFEDFAENETLLEWRKTVDAEIKSVLDDFKKNKETKDKIVFYEIKSELNITAILANILAEKNADKFIVVSKHAQEGWKVSTRSPREPKSEVDLSKVVSEAAKGIGYGGGHPQAAGALVKNWEKFKEKMSASING